MNRQKLIHQAIGVTLVALLLSSCGMQQSQPTPTSVPPTATPTPTPAPPCFGLVQVDKLPDWAGGFAIGERYSGGGFNFLDLTSVVGCEVEAGLILINEVSFWAFVDDCESFESSDIPPQELRPCSICRWLCFQPAGDGEMQLMTREG